MHNLIFDEVIALIKNLVIRDSTFFNLINCSKKCDDNAISLGMRVLENCHSLQMTVIHH